ncbi:MAG: hypothetical protein ACKV2T_19930, partial [Kofleriaceae bacterium]
MTVLFGGRRDSGFLADTWVWSGTAWTAVEAAGPPARAEAVMAYDPVADRTILFGGISDQNLADTWQLRDGAWTQLAETLGLATQTVSAAMMFDPVARAIVLVQDTNHYQLDGSTWTLLGTVPADPALPRWLVFDAVSKQRLLIGAVPGELNPSLHTWAWEGGGWNPLPRVAPRIGFTAAVVADAVRGGVHILRPDRIDTWAPDGTLSTTSSVQDPPPGVFAQTAVNDLVRNQVVVFGGNAGTRNAPVPTSTTHIYDGARWRQLSPIATAPPARWKHAMAYDPVRERVVVFGGESTNPFGDTWEWDGVAWTRLATTGPSPRSDAAMAFSAPLGRIILFGGRVASTAFDDTWGWDGTTWTRIDSPSSP